MKTYNSLYFYKRREGMDVSTTLYIYSGNLHLYDVSLSVKV